VHEVAGAIRDEVGFAEAFPADVTDEQQVGALMGAVSSPLGPVDVLVITATGPQPESRTEPGDVGTTSRNWPSS
jgi:3-oxoacyl-[acyl-carrier protein] reductase